MALVGITAEDKKPAATKQKLAPTAEDEEAELALQQTPKEQAEAGVCDCKRLLWL